MFKSRGRAEDAKGRKRTMVTAACSVTGLVIGQSTYAQGDDLGMVKEAGGDDKPKDPGLDEKFKDLSFKEQSILLRNYSQEFQAWFRRQNRTPVEPVNTVPEYKTSEVDTGNGLSSEVGKNGTNSLNHGKIVTGVLFFGFWLTLTLLIIGVAIELNKKSVANVNGVLRIALKFGLWFASMFAIYLIGVIFYAIWGFLF